MSSSVLHSFISWEGRDVCQYSTIRNVCHKCLSIFNVLFCSIFQYILQTCQLPQFGLGSPGMQLIPLPSRYITKISGQSNSRSKIPRSEKFRSQKFRSEKFRSQKFRSRKFRSERFRSQKFRSEKFRSRNFRSEKFRSQKFRSQQFRSEKFRSRKFRS